METEGAVSHISVSYISVSPMQNDHMHSVLLGAACAFNELRQVRVAYATRVSQLLNL